MDETANSVFRKTALERAATPEQLNEYIKITNPRVWILLVGLLALLSGVAFWAFFGSIPQMASLNGIAYSREGPVDTVFAYAPMGTARRLAVGMPAQVSPDYAPRDEYGYISGKVTSIGEKRVSDSDIRTDFGDLAEYAKKLLPARGIAVKIEIRLDKAGDKLNWSSPKGQNIQVTSGSDCSIRVITGESRPYQLIF